MGQTSVLQFQNERIPVAKLGQFHEILCATGGRYLANPEVKDDVALVSYEMGDSLAHLEAWDRCTTPIREVRSDQSWRCWARRVLRVFR